MRNAAANRWLWGECLLAWAVMALLMQGFIWWAGGNASWDFLNHHVYLGRQWLQGQRLSHDLMAAGIMVCQNPIGYAPLVAMLDAGWSGNAVFAAHVFFYSLLAPASWLLAWLLVPERGGQAVLIRVGLVALACTGSLHWRLMTQTSNDVMAFTLVFAGVVLLAWALEQARWQGAWRQRLLWVALAGAVLALASLVKLSSVFGVAVATALLLFMQGSWRQKTGLWLACLLGGLLMVALAGDWLWTAWRYCGSPLHPFGMDWFQANWPLAP